MKVIDRIRRHRGFIRLLRLDALARTLNEPCGDPALRARLVSELTMRAWLYAGGGDWRAMAEREVVEAGWRSYGLAEGIQDKLTRWLCDQGTRRGYALPDLTDCDVVLVDFLKRDLGDYENAHGVIPFVVRGDGPDVDPVVILPFMLRTSDISRVMTADGLELRQLSAGVEHATQGLTGSGILKDGEALTVILTSLHDPGVILNGTSLGLPVIAAGYFRRKDVKPRALSVGLSGSLDHSGRLDVELRHANNAGAKAERLARYGIPVRIFAAGAGADAATDHWPVAQALDNCLEALGEKILMLEPEHRMPEEDPAVRLDAIQHGIHYGVISARQALEELGRIESSLAGRSDIHAEHHRLVVKSLQASALCHLGNARDSLRVAGELIGMRHEIGNEYIAEALVRQAVNMTDFADYAQAVDFADEAFRLARGLKLVERSEMELKAFSSRAQAMTSWALLDPAKREEARVTTLRAVEMAREVDSFSRTRDKNTPRNLVYAFLWHALHDPAQAMKYGAEIRKEVAGDQKSWLYYLRVRWLAAYRGLLTGVAVEWKFFEDQMPGIDDEGGWLFALCSKYRGALRAADGDLAGAATDFRASIKLLEKTDSSPLLAFLSATAGVQAAESMRDSACEMADQCMPVLDKMSDWYAEPRISAPAWVARLTGLREGRDPVNLPHPQLFYPY